MAIRWPSRAIVFRAYALRWIAALAFLATTTGGRIVFVGDLEGTTTQKAERLNECSSVKLAYTSAAFNSEEVSTKLIPGQLFFFIFN